MGLCYDLLLAGGDVVFENGVRKANIAVKDGKIAAILAPGFVVEAKEIKKIEGLTVFGTRSPELQGGFSSRYKVLCKGRRDNHPRNAP